MLKYNLKNGSSTSFYRYSISRLVLMTFVKYDLGKLNIGSIGLIKTTLIL